MDAVSRLGAAFGSWGLSPHSLLYGTEKLPVRPLLCKVPRSWRHTRRGVVFLGGHEAGRSPSGADSYGKPEGTFFTSFRAL